MRRNAVLAAFFGLLCLLMGARQAEATCPVIPFVFSPGTTIDPTQANANWTALRNCINAAVPPSTRLFTDINYYVSTAGSDSNNCAAATVTGADGPCLTINHALAVALATDAKQGNVVINIGTGTFNENISFAGYSVGTVGNPPFITNVSMPQLVLSGQGSPLQVGPNATIIRGVPLISGNSFCYTILATNMAQVSLRNLAVKADVGGGACTQSDLFVQSGAIMYIDADVELLDATGNLIAMEEQGGLYVSAGSGAQALVLGGNAGVYGVNVGANSWFAADSTVGIKNSPTFTGGFLFLAETGSLIKLSGNPAVDDNSGGGAPMTGAHFYLGGNSVMNVATPPTVWPGTQGIIADGSRYQAVDSIPCIGGSAGCPQVLTANNLGASGTVGVSSRSSAYGIAIQLSPAGAGIGNTGFVYLGRKTAYLLNGLCSWTRANGTGQWEPIVAGNPPSTFWGSGFETANGFFLQWDNGGVNLGAGLTYEIQGVCNTGTY
jgi:hypothetical protein